MGDWPSVVRNVELGYAEVAPGADFAPGTGSETDITGLSLTVTIRDRPIVIRFASVYVKHASAAGVVQIQIKEGATRLGGAYLYAPAAANGESMDFSVRVAPTAGAHSYKATVSTFGGNPTVGGEYSLQIVEV